MPTYRPDIRPDFDLAAWNRTPEQIAARAQAGEPMDGWLMNGKPTEIVVLKVNEIKVNCPRCGSPYIAAFSTGEKKYAGKYLPDFVCVAGDCEEMHPKMCSATLAQSDKPEDVEEAHRRCAVVHGPGGVAIRSVQQ